MKKPTKREAALGTIKADVAENGHITSEGLRAYTENRISRQALNEAIKAGLRLRAFIAKRDGEVA